MAEGGEAMSAEEPIPGASGIPMTTAPTIDGLTPEWLTAQLRAIGVIHVARVASIDITNVDEFGMSGTVRRLALSYDRPESGAPASLVAKFASEDVEVRTMLDSMGFYEREARFYLELAARSPVRTAQCYFASAAAHSGPSLLLLLEDLTSLSTWGWTPCATVAEVEVVLRELASLHAAWWADDRLRRPSWLALRGMAAADQVQPVFERYWEAFLAKLSIPVTEQILDVGRYGARYLASVSAVLYGSGPITLIHNDVQGANILFDGGHGSAVLIDWQLTTIGRGAVDVAYFVCGCLTAADRRSAWDPLVRTYHQLLLERGVAGYSLAQCQIDCRLALLPMATRIATAVGAIPGLQAEPGAYWNDIFPRYAQAIGELAVGELLAEKSSWAAGTL